MTIQANLMREARESPRMSMLTHPWRKLCLSAVRRLRFGALEATLPDGQHLSIQGPEPGPSGQITVTHPNFFRRLLTHGALGFGEMYMDGWWTTSDLDNLLDVFLANSTGLTHQFSGRRSFLFAGRLRHFLNRNTRRGARRNIAHHYDLGNEFYAQWLDGTMTYSSALFAEDAASLESAQANKNESICRMLGLAPGDRVLEIGCGWGGFAAHAIRNHGVEVTGITLSREQLRHARAHLRGMGLDDQAEILLCDYRDVTGEYDKIVSIEMIEAVGERYWPDFFTTIRKRLRPGGTAVIQAITISDAAFDGYRSGTDFMQKYIFPGGMLPSPGAIAMHTQQAGLQVGMTHAFPESYDRTLCIWRQRFNNTWDSIRSLGFDQRFHRMWNYYLAGSAAVFRAGITSVTQMTFHKPGESGIRSRQDALSSVRDAEPSTRSQSSAQLYSSA